MPRPAVAYVRASTRKQELSCDDQLTAVEAYCAREGLALARVFRDDGVSGTRSRGRRPAWDELLAWIEGGHLAGGVVVVWSMDRWARDFRAGLLAAWSVADLDAELHTTDAGRVDLDSVEGQIVGALKLAVAAQESRERSRRTRERKRLHLAEGYWVTRPPYGYALVGSRGRKQLVPDEAEAPVVVEIYERYDAGASYGEIAGALAAAGLTTRHGNEWMPDSVRRILTGWSYGGYWCSRDGHRRPVRAETFLPPALWERCRDRAAGPGGRRGRRPRFPLSGLVYCGECGRRMRVHSWPTRIGGVRRGYRCPGKEVRQCDNPTIAHVERLERAVVRWWRSLADHGGAAELAGEIVATEHAEAVEAAMRRGPIEDELRDLERQEQRLVDAIREAGISPVIRRSLDLVRQRRADLEARLGDGGDAVLPFDVAAVAAELEDALAAVDSPGELREYIDEIVVTAGREVAIRALGREVTIEI